MEHVLQLSIITAVFVFMRLGRLGRLGAVAMMEMMGSVEVAQLPSCQYESTGVITGQGESTSNWPRVCGIALRGHLFSDPGIEFNGFGPLRYSDEV